MPDAAGVPTPAVAGTARDPRTRVLLDGPVGPTLLRLAAPNVAVMAAQTSIGLIETWFIGKFGLDALTGVALVFPLLMLLQMLSAGAVGGGILSAVARSLGRQEDAGDLAWAGVAIGLGLVATLAGLAFGPALFAALGGRAGSLDAAVTYSTLIFAGAVPLWLFNSLAAVIRGTGNMAFPATVTTAGAVVLIPISPLLIFGAGPVPALGIAGGAAAVVIYYVVGSVFFAWLIWSGRGVLRPAPRPPRLAWGSLREILRVGAASSVTTLSTNLSIITATGLAGLIGPAAVAGYGTAVRLEYLLVPLVFGLGAPMAAMVGTAIGAGQHDRALRVAWAGAAFAAAITEAIGITAAAFPHAWLSLFGDDPEMIATGSSYLRIVGPFYGFFGGGLALYFASQGAGRVGWPTASALLRLLIAAGGGWLAVTITGNVNWLFVVLAASLVVYGASNAAAFSGRSWVSRVPPRFRAVAATPQVANPTSTA